MTKFKGTPLFGQDSSPRYTSDVLALIFTAIFWFIFLICMIVIKPAKKEPKLKEVQIVLSSTPVKKQEEAPAPAEAAAAASSESVVQEAQTEAPAPVVETPAPAVKQPEPAKPKVETPKVETPKVQKETPKPKTEPAKPKTEPKPEPKKTPAPVPKPAAPIEPIEYAVDPMEAFAQQTASKPKKEFNWDMFDDEPAVETAAPQERRIQPTEPVMSGFAAEAADNTSQNVESSSSTNTNANKRVNESTSSALANIANTSFSGKAVNGVNMETKAKTATSGSGKVMMEMSNGSSRALLDPDKPIINLSEQAAATIDGSRTVKIRFSVVEAGNVPRGEISITPESILAEIVRKEIKDQVSKWRFEPADYIAFAEFEYKIVKQ